MNGYAPAASAPGMPGRGAVRQRLTLLYAALFLASGAALLAITYALVSQATPGVIASKSGVITGVRAGAGPIVSGPVGTGPAGTGPAGTGPVTSGPAGAGPVSVGPAGGGAGLPAAPGALPGERVRAYVAAAGAAENNVLLLYSGIGLAIMTVISACLGWFAAGRALRPLEAAYEAQRQFVANASHELRTPLTRARTLLEVALRGPSAQALRTACERALAAGEETERLIAALLTLARGQRGLSRRDPLDLAALTRRLLADRGEAIAGRGVSVAARVAPAPVLGDPVLAERMVANLLDNAVGHNVAGGSVWVTAWSAAGRAALTVANTGPVIPPGDVARLLQPFQRRAAARVRADGGLGLGLPVVKAIAEAHGGALSLAPRPGGGLTASLTFPAAPCSPAPAPRSGRPLPAMSARSGALPGERR